MRGAIIGDITGSPYEFCENKDYWFPPLYERRTFTDDTVMTCAVAKALMVSRGKSDDEIRKELIRQMKCYGRKYIDYGFGGMMHFWLESDSEEPYGSWGNGSAMRVSSVGWLYDDPGTVLHMAELTASVTHNTEEGIRGAQAVALAVFLARKGFSKRVIRRKISALGYDLNRSVNGIRENYSFDVSCEGSVPESIICFLESKSFEDAVRNAVSLGGDADTQGCMTGAIAEAYYGINGWEEYEEYLPDDLKEITVEFQKVSLKREKEFVDFYNRSRKWFQWQ